MSFICYASDDIAFNYVLVMSPTAINNESTHFQTILSVLAICIVLLLLWQVYSII